MKCGQTQNEITMYNVEKIDKSCDPGLIYFHDDGWLSSLSCFASKQFKPLHSLFFFCRHAVCLFFFVRWIPCGIIVALVRCLFASALLLLLCSLINNFKLTQTVKSCNRNTVWKSLVVTLACSDYSPAYSNRITANII